MNSVKFIQTTTAVLCIIVQPIADINASHVFNELWTDVPHAIFHMAWLLCATVTIGLVTLYLVWGGNYEGQGSRLAAVMGGVLPIIA